MKPPRPLLARPAPIWGVIAGARRGLLLLATGLAFALGAEAAPPPARVFVIGDSISIYYGPFLEKALAPRFAYDRMRAEPGAGTGNLDLPTGANGGDSRRVLAYLRQRQARAPLPPGYLLLNCGLHDIKRDAKTNAIQVPLEEYTANLRTILTVAAAMQQRVVWVRTTPVVDAVHNRKPSRFLRFAADVDAYNAAADAVMRAAGVPVVDLYAFSRQFGPEAYADHVHYREPIREKQAAFLAAAINTVAADHNPARWVDPFIGTAETALPPAEGIAAQWISPKPRHGHLHPGATTPFGLVSVVPYGGGYPTGYWRGVKGGPCSGFTHFQQSGTGAIGKYYNFVRVAPVRGAFTLRKPGYELTDESASPGVFRARIADAGIEALVTVSRRAAFHRYVFTGPAPAHLVIDLAQAYDGWNARTVARPTAAEYALVAPGVAEGRVVIDGLPLYFHLEIDGAVQESGAWAGEDKIPGPGPHGLAAGPFGLWFSFAPDTAAAQVRLGFSFKSVAQARATLAEEMPSPDFGTAAAGAEARWTEYLGRIDVEGGTPEQRTLFYTALYRALIKPADATGENPFWDSPLPWYVDFATLWDIYKTQAPLLMTFYPERGRDMANALLNLGARHGRFPVGYLLPDELRFDDQGVDFAQLILADAWQKRVAGIDWPRALPQLVSGLKSTGRHADAALQYAYASACLVPVAEKLGDRALAGQLRAQALTWRQALDPVTHKLPPAAGSTGGFSLYEGGVWNYSFAVWQDMPGLIGLYPSREAFVQELDRFFGFAGAGGADLPFEGLNNQADMEVPYAYVFAGRADRTQEIVHALLQHRFATGRGGWPGNDDSGGISAWYVWNALGLFPLVGRDLYLIGTPQFPRARFNVGGKTFAIEAQGLAPDSFFVQAAELNGRPLERAWLSYDELAAGGQLTVHLGPRPSAWGSAHPPP